MTEPDPATQALLEVLYERFNARDVDAILPSLAPDVEWPNGWEGGYVRGRDAVRDYWTRQWRAMDASSNRPPGRQEPRGRTPRRRDRPPHLPAAGRPG